MIPYFYNISASEYITVYARTEKFARQILQHVNPDMAKKAMNIPWPTPDQHCIGEYGLYRVNTKTNKYAACIKPAAIRDAQYTKTPSHEANPLDDEQWLDLEDSPAFITVIEAETEDDAITAAAKYADTSPDNIDVYKFNPLEQL